MRTQPTSASFPFVGKLGRIDLGRIATYQDVLDAPESVVAELIAGQLYVQSRPRVRHGLAQVALGTVLGAEFQDGLGRQGGWRLLPEPELHIDDDVLVPDLAGWRIERFPRDHGDAVGVKVAPDWVCEILSPSTMRKDRMLKIPRYAKAGVSWAWVVDPEAELLEVFRRDGEHWVLVATAGDEAELTLPPFETLDLPLARIWYRDALPET